MLTLNNVATQDKYVEALTLGPIPAAQKIVYLVANNAAIVQLAGHSEDKTVQPWGDELLITPTTGEFQRIQGMRFKSAIAGAPAQVVAQLVEPGDPVPVGGTPFTASLSPSGVITPGNSSVQVDKNGVLVGTEPILDLVVAQAGAWAVADDVANTKILVTPPKMITGKIHGADGSIMQGTGFTCVRTAVGTYTVSFNAGFAAAPVAFADQVLLNPALPSFATVDLIGVNSMRLNSVSGGANTDLADVIFLAVAMA